MNSHDEPFQPELIDEQLRQLDQSMAWPTSLAQSDGLLVQDLRQVYTEYTQSGKRVWQRLSARLEQQEAHQEQSLGEVPPSGLPSSGERWQHPREYLERAFGTGQEQVFSSTYDQPMPHDKLRSDPIPRRFSRRDILLTLLGLGVGTAATGGAVALLHRTASMQTNGLPGRMWRTQTSYTEEWLYDVAWSGRRFVAVGDGGTILTSPDGHTWRPQHSGTSNPLFGVAWLNSQFVAVGGGTILTSPDGYTWAPQRFGVSTILESVVWSGTQFVAVGSSGAILTSPDGHTWTTRNYNTSSAIPYLQGVAWSGTQYVAVGYSGTILTSPDGHTWTTQNAHNSYHLSDVVWSGSQFVAVGADAVGSGGTILTSPDGHTWIAQNSDTPFLHVAWSGTQYVAVGYSGTISASPDGHIWAPQSSGTAQSLSGVAWSGTQFVAVGNGGTILTSP